MTQEGLRLTCGFAGGPVRLMVRVYRDVLPGVYRELAGWRRMAEAIPDPELRRQALASMTAKRFHCEGGAVYAAAAPTPEARRGLIRLIVALQTISDYLDNLCDRSTSLDPADFRQLHQAMRDAVVPDGTVGDYYACRRERDDGGYLAALVRACQEEVAKLPGYGAVAETVRHLVALYADLQVHKHVEWSQREARLLSWWEAHRAAHPDLRWNEFAAATGSTLGMFALFLAATDPHVDRDTVRRIVATYFPWVCALHILLDYLIDQEEDRRGGDLNFVAYYRDAGEAAERLVYFARRAREATRGLPDGRFHRLIVDGLLGLYLSDGKVRRQRTVRLVSRRLLATAPLTARFFYVNSVLIRAFSPS